jgi:hypothetical protein
MGCGGASYDGAAVDSVFLFQAASKALGATTPGQAFAGHALANSSFVPISVDRRHSISRKPRTPATEETRQRSRLPERRFMFTAEQYRSKALEYEVLIKTARSPAELAEYRDLQQSYTSFADNLDWLAANAGKTVTGGANGAPAAEQRKRQAEHIDEEKILRCLGAAVILHWNTIPTQLQRALFEAASSIQGARPAPLKDALAQFLHDHKDDAQRERQHESRA